MAERKRGPKPTVWYDGNTYKCRSYTVEIPDLDSMERLAALGWICRNTYPTGYSKPNPLAGLGGVVSVSRG